MMQLVAERPGNQVLIQVTESTGFIYELGANKRGIDQDIQSILARGYWEESSKEFTNEHLQEIVRLPVG